MALLPESILGHQFTDTCLLQRALTHPSYLNEFRNEGEGDYQRLEFLGDAVLGLCLADLLSERFPSSSEGELSRLRASLVDQPRLAELARQSGIAPHILLGRGEEQDQGREKASILADIFEALLGAVYYDAGFAAVRELVWRLYRPLLERLPDSAPPGDAKSELQEWLAARQRQTPRYELLSEEGPAHDRRFRVAVLIEGRQAGQGAGRSKKAAQQAAAQEALETLRSSCSP